MQVRKWTGKRNPVHWCGERKLVEFLSIEIRIQIFQNIRNKATIRSTNTTLGHMPKDLLQQRYSHMQACCCSVYIGRGRLLEPKSYHLFILHSQSSCLHSRPSTQPHSQLGSAKLYVVLELA